MFKKTAPALCIPLEVTIASNFKLILLLLVSGLLFLPKTFGQLTASGTLSETLNVGSTNTYTITLQNTSGSGSIETFWFAWVPGQDYLDTDPLSVQLPAGWTDIITHGGASDGYAIQFDTSTNPIAPGGTLSGFGFTSTDTLAQLAGFSNFYPGTHTTTSEISTGPSFAGTSGGPFVVTVASVPEPGASVAILSGLMALGVWRWRRRTAR